MCTLGYSQGNSNRDYWTRITERELNMELKHQKKLDKFKGGGLFKTIEPIKFDDIRSFIKQGKLQFKNPKNTETLVAVPTNVRATANGEFEWYGNFEDGRGFITIMAKGNDLFGHFSIDDEAYEIHDLGSKRNLLVKLDKTKPFICASPPANRVGANDPSPSTPTIINRSPLSCDNNVRILVLYTPTAEQFLNVSNLAALGVGGLNNALLNSGITSSELSFTLAGTALLPGFVEDRDITITYNKFLAIDISNLRRDYQADLAILITGTNFEEGHKGVTRFNFVKQNGVWVPNPEKWRNMISGNGLSSNFGFQHEIAHLFNCNHENEPDFSNIGLPGFENYPNIQRAKIFTTRTCRRCGVFFTCCTNNNRQTIMAGTISSTITTIPHFSNPNISFEGTSTGEIGFRNNVQILKDHACHISNYWVSTPPMEISISGPSNTNSNEYYTWCASVTNCSGVTNIINWEVSTNGIDYTPFGSGPCVSSSLPSAAYFAYLRVTAICSNGNSVVNYFPININQGNPYGANPNGDIPNDNDIHRAFDNENAVISPNPSSDKVQVSIKMEETNVLLVTLHDLSGKILKSITNTNVFQGILQFDLDVKEFSSGVYFIHTQSDNKTTTHKLIIQKQ